MEITAAIRQALDENALKPLAESLSLSPRQVAMGTRCAASAIMLGLLFRMEKGLGIPAWASEKETPESWVSTLFGHQYGPLINAVAAFAQTSRDQARACILFAAVRLNESVLEPFAPGQEDAFIRSFYTQKEVLMSTLPANVAASLDMAHLQAGLAPDFGRQTARGWLFRLLFLFLAGLLLIWALRHCR